MKTLPFTLPARYVLLPGQQPAISDVDTGGYDVLIGGCGFRLATDQQNPYVRATEPTTTQRADTSAEVGEQTLSALPWLKSQSSFHAGAGQLNLEAPFTAFQYQQEQIAHLRYETSLGVNPWTPGKVTRLPDTTFTNYGFSVNSVVTGSVNGVDYAVLGGVQALYLATWNSGPDAAPSINAIDMTGSVYGGMANITVESLTTDGVNYYGLIKLNAFGSTAGVLTYVIAGALGTTTAPTPIYDVAINGGPARHNLITNPSFEVSAAGWSTFGFAGTAQVRNTAGSWSDTGSCSLTVSSPAQVNPTDVTISGSTVTGYTPSGTTTNIATVVGQTYTFSVMARNSSLLFCPVVLTAAGQVSTPLAPGSSIPTRISVTFTATATTTAVSLQSVADIRRGPFPTQPKCAAMNVDIDSAMAELAPSGTYFDGSFAGCGWDGTAGLSASTFSSNSPITAPGVIGWVKERLIAGVANKMYELTGSAGAHTTLPTPKYTHPVTSFLWTAISESPTAILLSGNAGQSSSILRFELDSSGGTPTLSGGATVAALPAGEQVQCLAAYLGSFIAIGTNKGLRVGTFDTYTGNLTYGPLSLETTYPVLDIAGRDRFVFAGYSNQQADGTTGLARVDLSQPIDTNNRLAWAPDLRPPTSAPTGTGSVTGVAVLPASGRLIFVSTEGIHVEGNGPGSNGAAWLRTSRIRYDTDELKLFKAGRVHGALDQGTITITGIVPFGLSYNLGTFGFLSGSDDPGEFGLPTGLNPWIQLQFQLNGSGCVLNSYTTKALPAPSRQRLITVTVNCFRNETDRFGLDVTDPKTPRERFQAVSDLEQSGNEIRFVEFTNLGSVATLVVIDKMQYAGTSRPSIEDDFGGVITFQLRMTQT